jgi:hypothetical protein
VDPWIVGIVIVLLVGVVVIVYGALSDRRKNKRAAAEMLAPPDREIPHFSPHTPAPHYLSELQARRRPAGGRSTDLSTADRDSITRLIDDPATSSIAAGMVSAEFVTDHRTGWAVLDRPYVLVCAEPPTTVRELLGVLEKVLPTGNPLVIVAPSVRGEVRDMLEVNAIQQTMSLLAVEAGRDALEQVARLTDTEPVPRGDLQSSWISVDRLGRCALWVSTASRSHLIKMIDTDRDPGSEDTQARP